MKQLRQAAVIACLCLLAREIPAQAPSAGSSAGDGGLVARTICILTPEDRSDDPADLAPIGELIADTLGIMLAEAGYEVLPLQEVRAAASASDLDLSDTTGNLAFARSLGADTLVTGVYRGEGNSILISVIAWDILTERPATSVISSGPAGFDIYDTVDEASLKISDRIRETLKPLPASVITVYREEVTVKTTVVTQVVDEGDSVGVLLASRDNGARVLLGGEKELGVIEGRQIIITTKASSVLDLTLEKDGYYPLDVRLNIKKESLVKELPALYRKPRLDLGFVISSFRFPGASLDARMHSANDAYTWGAFAGAAVLYRFADDQNSSTSGTTDSTPLPEFELGLTAGWYPLLRGDSPYRANLGLNLRFTGMVPSTDIGMVPFLGFGPEIRFERNFPVMILYVAYRGDVILWDGIEGFIGMEKSAYVQIANLGVAWKF